MKKSVLLYFAAIVGLSGLFLFCGCEPAPSPTAAPKAPLGTVSLHQAAAQLGLSIKKADFPYLEMSGPNNRVLIFLYERGRVYVNGIPVGPAGKVQQINGTYFISEQLLPQIRGSMLPATTATMPDITKPSLPGPIKTGVIVVDPGHGGRDPGTTSVLGTPEKGINLKIAQKLTDHLRKAGYKVVMTRETDTYIDKEDRAAFANRVNPDFFISIHCDSNENSTHRGFSVYIARQPSWTSTKMARQIENKLSSAGFASKGLRYGDYVVLVQTHAPAVLVECGFLSNYDDANKLTNSWYQGKLAKTIADAIIQNL